MNLACSTQVVEDGEVRDDLKLRVLHWLLLNVTSSYGKAFKTMREWSVGARIVMKRKVHEVT